MRAYIGPGNQIVSALVESFDDRMLDNVVREIDVKSILDKCPAWFTA